MIKKLFYMDEADTELIASIKESYGMSSEAETVRYIIRRYAEAERQGKEINLAALRKIEEKLDLLLDVTNTDLIKRKNETCYPVSMVESTVIRQARSLRRKELANKKQKKDFQNRKSSQ